MNRSKSSATLPPLRRTLRGIFALAATGVLVAGLGVGCSQDNPSSISVPLTFKPKENLSAAALASQTLDAKVFVAPVMDERPAAQRDRIGENTEHSDSAPIPVIAEGDVAAFMHNVLADQLLAAGLTVVSSQAEADRVLQPTLNQFWVVEGGTYDGTVSATFTVLNKSNAKLWGPGKFTGAAGNWGKSKNVNNYQETFSESTQKLIESLLSNPGFRTSLSKAAAPAAITPVPTPAIIPTTPKATTPKANPLTRKPTPAPEPAVTETPDPKVENPALPEEEPKVEKAAPPEEPKVEIKAPAKEAADEAKDSATDAKAAAQDAKEAASEAKEAADDAKDANK